VHTVIYTYEATDATHQRAPSILLVPLAHCSLALPCRKHNEKRPQQAGGGGVHAQDSGS